MLASYGSRDRASRLVFLSELGRDTRENIVIDKDQVDTANTGKTHEFRKGNVVILDASAGKYVKPTDGDGDLGLPPVITSIEDPDADWASKVVTLKRNGATVAAVTLGGSDDSTSEVVTALNANAAFRAHAVASGADLANLVITGTRGGPGESLEVSINLDTAYASDDGSSSSDAAVGSDAQVRVTCEMANLKDSDGVAVDDEVLAARSGHFRTTDLIGLTAYTRGVLERAGSVFE